MNRTIRELENQDIPRIISYFLEADEDDLNRMGVAPEKLPEQAEWETLFLADAHRSVKDKQFYYLIWEVDEMPIGHACINKINFRKEAFMHLHIWDPAHRRSGSGSFFIENCIDRFFKVFQLERLLCEPNARNQAPNRTLEKTGFELRKTYETVPGWINCHQLVNQWELTRERWLEMTG